MVKIGLSSRGEGVETADLTAESTPLIACCKRPCEGPAMKNATMAAPEYNIVTLLGEFKRPVGTLVLLVYVNCMIFANMLVPACKLRSFC